MEGSDLLNQFEALDGDGSGLLDATELLAQMPEGDREKAQGVLAMMDADSDGRVSYKEFVGFYYGGLAADEAISDADDSVNLDNLTDSDGDGYYEESSS